MQHPHETVFTKTDAGAAIGALSAMKMENDIQTAMAGARSCFQTNRRHLYFDDLMMVRDLQKGPPGGSSVAQPPTSIPHPEEKNAGAERELLLELERVRQAMQQFVVTYPGSQQLPNADHKLTSKFLAQGRDLGELIWMLEHTACFARGDARLEDRLRMLHDRVKMLQRRAAEVVYR
mmetsp:Transcript_1838/g.4246  ORF Transcript_1838/g.4246 Transcript_1838/m.4246 type:complete len:177 (-) Transcript_1838:64-594(-)|eukprot:CAMPEP_0179002712 /NCGR_PEP_ID=MMETSP0795-20121207/12216_1 /TAXON_ID=88552 /ORGANISM="Amoebophrya sp., Strain Ameob2" /LENGTH=176 /DNA_ID=CAMNT_0020696523 /DNA_START=72 /DNA_END=602 /DNA_ORIENTATION=+